MTKPARLLAPVLFCAALGFTQPANAITLIDVNLGTASVTCDATGVDPECNGYVNGVPHSDSPPTAQPLGLGTVSFTNSDVWELSNQSPATQLDALNTVLGFDSGILLSNVTQIDFGGGMSAGFTLDPTVLYWSVTLGAGTAFFQNLASGVIDNLVSYLQASGTAGNAGGISHVTLYPIPLPAALPMFLLALGGAALVGRRRRRGVAGAA